MKHSLILLVLILIFPPVFCDPDTAEIKKIIAEHIAVVHDDPLKGVEILKKAELLLNEKTDLIYKLRIYSRMGKAYARMNDVGHATFYLDTMLALAANNQKFIWYTGDAYNSYSILSSGMGDFKKAIDYLLKAMSCFEKSRDPFPKWELQQNLAICYAQTGNLEKALFYFKDVARLCNDETVRGETFTNIGVVFDLQNLADSSIAYYKKAYAILEKQKRSQGLAMLLNNMAAVMLKQKKVTEGIKYLEKSLGMMQSTGDKKGIILALNNLSDVTMENGQLKEALKYAREAYTLASEGKLYHDLTSACDHMSRIFFEMNDTKNAYIFCRRYTTLNDSLKNSETIKQIAEMETKYETTAKEKAIEILKKDNELQLVQNSKNRIIIICLVSGSVILLGLLFLILRQFREKKKVNLQLERKNQIIEEKQKEIVDSIHYAQRIQKALITSEKYIEKKLKL